jgi:hypothetical protein
MLTAEQRDRCQQVLGNPGNKTRSELCRELGVSYLELSRIVTELGVALPPARRDPDRMKVPKETLEDLVQRGLNRSQIQIALGLSNRGLMRLLRDYHLEVLSPAQRNRQLETQGLRCCIECRQVKTLATDFYNDRTNPLGKNRRCKECLNRWSVRQRQHSKQVPAEERKRRYPWATQGLRRCRRCHEVKPLLAEFPPSPNERAGRSVCCHACHQARSREQDAKRLEQELTAQGLRRCCRCRQVKLLENEFGVNRRDPMGRQSRCRDCQREVAQSGRPSVGVARAAGRAVPGGAGLSSLTSLPPGFLPTPQPPREDRERPLHPAPSEPARESVRGDTPASRTALP